MSENLSDSDLAADAELYHQLGAARVARMEAEGEVDRAYGSSMMLSLRILDMPAAIERRLLATSDPAAVAMALDALSEWTEEEVDALVALDAAGVSMDVVHELAWNGQRGVENSRMTASQMLETFEAGGNLAALAGFRPYEQTAYPEVSSSTIAAARELYAAGRPSREKVAELAASDPRQALKRASDLLTDEEFAACAALEPDLAAFLEPERMPPRAPRVSVSTVARDGAARVAGVDRS